MKKILAVLTALVLVLSLAACAAKSESASSTADDKTTYTVGVCQLVQHDALDAATQGFVDALQAELGDAVSVDVQNASNDAVSAAAGTPEADGFSGRGGNPNVQAWFNGGELEAVAGGDVVDSNGNIYVTGGTLRLSAPPWPDYEGSLLCNGDVTITGGTIASVGCMGVNVYWDQQPILWVSHTSELPCGTVLSLRDTAGTVIVELTTLEDAVQSVFTSPKLNAGETYGLYVDGVQKVEVTLTAGMNAIGDDGGRFTGGYSRGNMAEYR